jgi:hypothetical protein
MKEGEGFRPFLAIFKTKYGFMGQGMPTPSFLLKVVIPLTFSFLCVRIVRMNNKTLKQAKFFQELGQWPRSGFFVLYVQHLPTC